MSLNKVDIEQIRPLLIEEAVCGGGKAFEDCDVMADLVEGTSPAFTYRYLPKREAFIYRSVKAYFPLGCVACNKMCEAVYEIIDGVHSHKQPAILSMDPGTYSRVRSPSLENLSRLLLESTKDSKEDRLWHGNDT